MPNRCRSRLQLDFDVVTQPIQAIHQLALGEIGEITPHHGRDLGLGKPHALRRLFLGQAKLAHGPRDFDDQSGLDLQLVGVRQAQVGEDVA
jgi:hypothetical protein